MARALRIDIRDGWYHVMARGTDRRTIFEDERDHGHFLELLEEMGVRYGVTHRGHVAFCTKRFPRFFRLTPLAAGAILFVRTLHSAGC